ncbi:hypothetical protein GGX14DRAFT_376214 [Mycena pura]|uniref:MYND-type domain-containing protein n=1 Tax=Mycena pura TaxID=153505 RepID=A0AAD6Y4N4_9AGAR|nr:hypothetical protein GGX14DRAFT_376214 [Mycena pura]
MLTVVAQTRSSNGAYYPWFLKHLEIFEPQPTAVIALSSRHLCAACGVSARVRCSACKKVWYCSKKCQENEWNGHFVECYPGRPITAADHLRAAAHRHKLPEDLEILSDYGFTRVGEVGSKILLDVYAIVFEGGVRARDLHQWNTSGKLLEEVEKVLKGLDSWKTYKILSWFEAHRYAFDHTVLATESVEEEVTSMVMRIKAVAVELWRDVGDFPSEDGDEIIAAVNNWSADQCNFFHFRSMLGLCYPGPDVDIWVSFGFCACHDESDENFLATTYQMLVDRSSYTEFFTAYRTSNIIQLLDAKGLRGRHMIDPYLEDVLSGSPHVFKSVWRLKAHVQDMSTIRSNLIPSVRVDYGFLNCKSDSEYQDLKDLYKNIFERRDANPIKLHEACISGSLYAYVLGLFPELKKKRNRATKFERLLRNMNPLRLGDL